MKRLVGPGDLVVITSDHGFVQLRRDRERITAVRNEAQPEVRRRYAHNREDLDGVLLPLSDQQSGTVTCAVGRSWFNRRTSRGRATAARWWRRPRCAASP